MKTDRIVFWISFILFLLKSGWIMASNDSPNTLTDLSIEELMKIEVFSAAKKTQTVSQTAAAIYVIGSEDIRRSGASSIPEILRMVPGVQVARMGSSVWAVSARGHNSRFSNKLLVMIDGRTVYSPVFSGVFWDEQDIFPEDIDRIEVIRGPGASLWGANAVNGIINIITKSADATQGGLITGGIGTEEKIFGGARYGGHIGKDASYRIYAKYFDRDSLNDTSGQDADDDWQRYHSGFRADGKLSDSNIFSLQGNINRGTIGQTAMTPSLNPREYDNAAGSYLHKLYTDNDVSEWNILGRWQHILAKDSDMSLQLFFDRIIREEAVTDWAINIFDMEFQHRFPFCDRADFLWGMGYRLYEDSITNSPWLTFDPSRERSHLFNAFFQSDIDLVKDRLRLTLGSKFEHSEYGGVEIQPNIRLLYTPNPYHSVWGAVSRAVRTPNRQEESVRFWLESRNSPDELKKIAPFPLAALIYNGNDEVESEELIAAELGYRFQYSDRFSMDIALFYHFYDKLMSSNPTRDIYPDLSSVPPHWIINVRADNLIEEDTYGAEFSVKVNVSDVWQLMPSYTLFQTRAESDYREKIDPQHQLSLRSLAELHKNVEFDVWLRYTDSVLNGQVNGYFSADVRLGWKPLKNLELSVIGRNIGDPSHPEYLYQYYRNIDTEVEREVLAKVTWKF